LVDPIRVNDYLIFDETINSDFLRGAHRVIAATNTAGSTYDLTVLNKYSGATGTTTISSSVFGGTGSIKVADVVFSMTSGTSGMCPQFIWLLNSPSKTVAFGMTGGTGKLDTVFTGWQCGQTSTGIQVINGASVALGSRVWFTDLTYGVVADNGSVYDSLNHITTI